MLFHVVSYFMVPVAVVKVILGIEHRAMTLNQIRCPVFTFNFERRSWNIGKAGIKLVILLPQPLKLSLLTLQTMWFLEGHFPTNPDERP